MAGFPAPSGLHTRDHWVTLGTRFAQRKQPMHSTDDIGDPADLIACPSCDALYKAERPPRGGRAVCLRCHRVLIAPRAKAGLRIIALSVAVSVLVVAATLLPFMEIRAVGFGNRASLIDVATSFRSGALVLVSVATIAVIVLIPLLRTILLIYVLAPLVADRRPARGSQWAFRTAQALKPWAMTEIFAIGCVVALVKVSSLAHLGFGPAFWMFAILVIIVAIKDSYMCTWSVWSAIEEKR